MRIVNVPLSTTGHRGRGPTSWASMSELGPLPDKEHCDEWPRVVEDEIVRLMGTAQGNLPLV